MPREHADVRRSNSGGAIVYVNHRQGAAILAKLDKLIHHYGVLMSDLDTLTKAVADLTTAVATTVTALATEVAALKQANANVGNDPAIATAAANIETLVGQLNTTSASIAPAVTPAPAAAPVDPAPASTDTPAAPAASA
jgi:hypothetical protein